MQRCWAKPPRGPRSCFFFFFFLREGIYIGWGSQCHHEFVVERLLVCQGKMGQPTGKDHINGKVGQPAGQNDENKGKRKGHASRKRKKKEGTHTHVGGARKATSAANKP